MHIMKCPLSGKPCTKHKGFHIAEKHGDKTKNYSVCKDCLYLSVTKGFELPEPPKCDFCGGLLEDMLKASRMGCAKCYDNFAEEMSYVISSVQFGADRHVGSVPELHKRKMAEETKPEAFVREIKKRIIDLTDKERYEEVSDLKKTLDKFEEIVESGGNTAEFIYDFRESTEGL